MSILISKTTFQHYLHCPKDAWLKLHKPELKGQFTPSEFDLHLMEQGNEVESFARNLFTGGIEVSTRGEHAVEDTAISGSRASHQPGITPLMIAHVIGTFPCM